MGGLFHQPGICHDTAIAFFKAGFTNVDVAINNITPSMNLWGPVFWERHARLTKQDMGFYFSRYFHTVEFFVEKGGCLDNRNPSCLIIQLTPFMANKNSYRVIHRIAAMSWSSVGLLDTAPVDTIAKLGSSHIWRDIFQSHVSGPCVCACATEGCRPISLALKSSMSEGCTVETSLESDGWYTPAHMWFHTVDWLVMSKT